MPPPALIAGDVGNSRIKAASLDAAGEVVAFRAADAGGDLAPLAGLLRGDGPIAAASVSPGNLARLEEASGRRLPLVGRDLPLPVPDPGGVPPGTGPDRVCAAAAAGRRAGGAAVAVGLGTAVTVDAVDAAGRFLGGAIAPGLRAAAAGLAAAAPALPAAPLDASPSFPGRDTAAALAAGHLLGFAGLVDRLAGEAARAAAGGGDPAAIPVLLHGGDADRLRPLLRTPAILAPHLVIEGVFMAWRAG